MATKHPSVEQYLAAQPSESRAVLERVRAALRRALPGAEEVISYQIPAYRLPGGVVLFFAGWKQHFSIYPVTAGVRDALGAELEPYLASKGTLRFPLSERVPVRLITRIAKVRAQELAERAKPRTTRAKPRTTRAKPRTTRAKPRTPKPQRSTP